VCVCVQKWVSECKLYDFFKSQSFPQRLLPNHGNVSEETSMILPVANGLAAKTTVYTRLLSLLHNDFFIRNHIIAPVTVTAVHSNS